MPLFFVFIGIIILLILMMKFKLDAFFSLLITAFIIGVLNKMGAMAILDSVLKGIGETLSSIVLILVFGAMLGKLVEESGAAHTITNGLTKLFGKKNIQYAILITGFLVGIPMMYNASFLVLIPLIYALSSNTKLPLMYLGIPLSAALSVAHAYLPPSPAPVYVSVVFGADINLVLLYGLAPVIPACLLAGIVLSKFFKKLKVKPPKELYTERIFEKNELPGMTKSVLVVLSPVFLMLLGATLDLFLGENEQVLKMNLWQAKAVNTIRFLSAPTIALFLSVVFGIYALGLKQGRNMNDIMKSLGKSASAIAMIILIIAAGGALKQVLLDSGVADYIKTITKDISLNPLILTWCVAAILRLAIGSATVATMTAAGIMLPIVSQTNISPELMVLATGSGSLMFSHFNDIGFWMFKEYYNVSIKQTFAIWTVMESIVAIVGLICALLLFYVM